MNNRILQLVLKQYMFPIIGIIVVLSALPFSIWQISKVSSLSTKASDFRLIPYPGLTWSNPKPYTVSFLREPETANETIAFSEGQVVTAESDKNISQEIYFFYNQLLQTKGYTELRRVGNPTGDITWVATYESDGNICQLQYYPTPYVPGHFTVLLFFGNT